VRLRLVGGRVAPEQLRALSRVATAYGDGGVHLTARANLQLRGLPHRDGVLAPEVVAAIEATGLLPSRTHELVRNVMVSPPGAGERADLAPVASRLDDLVCADPGLAGLPGRFLWVLDSGRGDLLDRPLDLGLVALDADRAQLRVGADGWGETVALSEAAERLTALAARFQALRGSGPDAPWHVDELPAADRAALAPRHEPDPRTHVHADPLPYDDHHVEAPDGVLDTALVDLLTHRAGGDGDLVVTPWHGVLVPSLAHLSEAPR
jgi:precorrin-3B synthase